MPLFLVRTASIQRESVLMFVGLILLNVDFYARLNIVNQFVIRNTKIAMTLVMIFELQKMGEDKELLPYGMVMQQL
ncbi:Oidioi.mRNA.OKI2018_I69.chr2.g4193.t1.cds [Oikopleura dioica]|uniref:Oidioi.mRNA.OKI2018_I69.chr2.g4193.t1.cds n=1 Tax=Oikopleura dioica TaxID=34765 RepID=A0ABN7T0S0_OIKDI|nr:Oidioi.mRNA.OKI2018_I69.chr2.g4193.t1.cds [Oikopleura dioica]